MTGPLTMDEEFQVIETMLNTAGEYSLDVEVVRSFGEFRSQGLIVVDAVDAALQEWDI